MLSRPPADPVSQLQWLVDRAEISDLFYAFARAIDEKSQGSYADCFAEDGVVTLPHGRFEGQDAIRAMRGPPAHWGTHHIQGNHQVSINGDSATARVYVIASHTFEVTVLHENARAGGWYDVELTRASEGWRIKSIALKIVWNTGEMIRGAAADGGMPPERKA
jgi:ketosteroid isomerase-like protein